MKSFEDILKGGDLRSIGKVTQVISQVEDQQKFDILFRELYNSDRKIVMRAADAIEKITVNKPFFLTQHKNDILALCRNTINIELKWHMALLVPRLQLTKKEISFAWKILTDWATNKKESRIVRVNSLQGLYNILQNNTGLFNDFDHILKQVSQENIPSIKARVKKFTNL